MSKLENAIVNFFDIRGIHLILIIALSIRTLGGNTIIHKLPGIIIVFFIYMTIYHTIKKAIFKKSKESSCPWFLFLWEITLRKTVPTVDLVQLHIWWAPQSV